MNVIRLVVALTATLAPMAVSGQGGGGQNPNRQAVEQRVRERMATMIQKRLVLTDDQMKKLGETNRRHDERRRLLLDQERDIRMGMRDEMLLAEKANQAKVAELLDRLLKVQRQRLDIVEQEQKELAGYLTPVQRVQFLALQDQMRKFRNEAQRRGGADSPGQRGRGGPRGKRPMGESRAP